MESIYTEGILLAELEKCMGPAWSLLHDLGLRLHRAGAPHRKDKLSWRTEYLGVIKGRQPETPT